MALSSAADVPQVSHPVAPSRTLTAKQHYLLREVLAGSDVATASEKVGVHRATAYRWAALPEFQAALREADREALVVTGRRLARISGKAVQVLLSLMSDPDAPASVRVRAADTVLSKVVQLREVIDFDERLAALEAINQEGKPR